MNYLAHLFLSCQSEESMIGNFLADMTTLKETRSIPNVYQEGVRLHRSIDHFTDQHPAVRSSIGLIRPEQRKYSPVVIDIYYDFLLYKNWSLYMDLPFELFTQKAYGILEKHLPSIPTRLHLRIRKMIAAKWLDQYTHYPGLHDVFMRLKYRSSFDNQLHNAALHLQEKESELSGHFREFFPELMEHVSCSC